MINFVLSITIISSLLQDILSGRGVAFKSELAIKLELEKAFNDIVLESKLENVNIGVIKNYESVLKEKSLDMTNIILGLFELSLENTRAICQDNTFKLEDEPYSGSLYYAANVTITFKENSKKVEGEVRFAVDGENMRIIATWVQDKESLNIIASADISAIYKLNNKIETDVAELNGEEEFIYKALKKHFEDNEIYQKIEAELKKEYKQYYQKKETSNSVFHMSSNTHEEKDYYLKMDNTEEPSSINIDGKCGLIFPTLAKYENFPGSQDAEVGFKEFDITAFKSVFLHKSVLTDFLTDASKDFAAWGILNSDNNSPTLPFAFNIHHLDKIIPGVVNQYSLSDKVSINFAFYEPELIFTLGKEITGTAKLDVTIYKWNTPVKQLLSFEAPVSFRLEPVFQKVFNLHIYDIQLVDGFNVRNNSEDVRVDLLEEWFRVYMKTIFDRNMITLMKKTFHFEVENVSYYEDGIRIDYSE
jgi:hypothetical protein